MRKVYLFQDSRDKLYFGEFESIDKARQFAYKAGYCFIGSAHIPDKETVADEK